MYNSTWPSEAHSCAGARAEGQQPYPLRPECVFCPRRGRWPGCASVLREGQSQGSLEGGFFVDAVVLGTSREACGRSRMGPGSWTDSQASPLSPCVSSLLHRMPACPSSDRVPMGGLGSCVQTCALRGFTNEPFPFRW